LTQSQSFNTYLCQRHQTTAITAYNQSDYSMATTLSPSNSPDNIYLTELGPYDVLLGRGTGPNENHGNVKFRYLLKERMNERRSNNGSTSPCKSRMIAVDIIDTVSAAGGRFVRKLTKDEIRACWKKMAKQFRYVAVDDKVAREKTKQSIRFQFRLAEKTRSSQDDGHHQQHHNNTSKSALAILQARQQLSSEQWQDPQEDLQRPAMSLIAGKASACGVTMASISATSRLPENLRSKLAESLFSQAAGTQASAILNLPAPPSLLPGSSLLSSTATSRVPTSAGMTSFLSSEQTTDQGLLQQNLRLMLGGHSDHLSNHNRWSLLNAGSMLSSVCGGGTPRLFNLASLPAPCPAPSSSSAAIDEYLLNSIVQLQQRRAQHPGGYYSS
jgi:hypothetical protein